MIPMIESLLFIDILLKSIYNIYIYNILYDIIIDFPQIVERLKLIYEDVEDVDLFIAGISETPVPGHYADAVHRC